MTNWKKGCIVLLTAFITVFFSGCPLYYPDGFDPLEHIGTRWVCQEIDFYFDINEVMLRYISNDTQNELYDNTPVRDTLCSGIIKIDDTPYCVRVNFDLGRSMSIYLMPDGTPSVSGENPIMEFAKVRYKPYELIVDTDNAEFFPPLKYAGKALSFEQYGIPDGERLYTLPTIDIPRSN